MSPFTFALISGSGWAVIFVFSHLALACARARPATAESSLVASLYASRDFLQLLPPFTANCGKDRPWPGSSPRGERHFVDGLRLRALCSARLRHLLFIVGRHPHPSRACRRPVAPRGAVSPLRRGGSSAAQAGDHAREWPARVGRALPVMLKAAALATQLSFPPPTDQRPQGSGPDQPFVRYCSALPPLPKSTSSPSE